MPNESNNKTGNDEIRITNTAAGTRLANPVS